MPDSVLPPPPSRTLSRAISAALVVLWGYLRLVQFETTVFPLAYSLPLLIGVWTRDRVAVWAMAGVFVTFHAFKIFWLVPQGLFTRDELWANYGATLANVLVAALAVHLIIRLRERLERAIVNIHAQADELRAQREELSQQNEELAEQAEELSHQTEELAQQGEELATQNEELQSQSEEIAGLNTALERREALLQTLLDTTRLGSAERTALQHIAAAAVDLFAEPRVAATVYERCPEGLRLRACAHESSSAVIDDDVPAADGFVDLVLHEDRTASLTDTKARPDLRLAPIDGFAAARSVLCAPVRFAGETFGAFALYAAAPREWTDEEFRLAEWLADQCGRVLQALRVQSDLRDADRRKSEFLATLSHELRNPLAPIGFALKLIEASDRPNARAIEVMRRQLQQLVRLVDDLLDATRLASNKIQVRRTPVDIRPIVQHAIDAVRPEIDAARHTISVVMPDQAVWVNADADRLSQVVANLLGNATRYTPRGGAVTLTVTAAEGEAVLSVADTGIGLEPGDCERIFDMFTQVGGPGSGGLGIGLTLVRGIVELHGGRVEARSEGPGSGSEFVVTLPLTTPRTTDRQEQAIAASLNGDLARVLVVDDNHDSAEMMGALLEQHGHIVHVVHDAEAALAAALDFSPEVALLDIGLPTLDGYELARRLRADPRTNRVRLVAVTGWGMESDRARARDAGFDAHLTKPVDPNMVLAAVAADPVA